MTAVIAEAYIRLRPKSDGFKSEADAQLDRSKPSDVTVDVKADTAAAKERLDGLRVSLDELRTKVSEAKVRLDGDAKAQTALDRIDFSLRKLGVTTAKPSISVEGAERAKIQLDEIEARLRAVGATTARPRVSGAGGSGGFLGGQGGLFGKGGFFRPSGLLGNAAVFLGPTAVPLAAAGAGLGASLLTPTVAGGLGLGLFGAAAKADLTRIDKVQSQLDKLNAKIAQTPQTVSHTTSPATAAQLAAAEARVQQAAAGHSVASYLSAQASLASLQARGGTTTRANPEYDKLVKQRTELLKQLSKPERDAAEGIDKLEKTWVHFQKALEPQTFKLVASGTDIATKGLTLMLPAVKRVGDVLDDLAKRADKDLSDPFWKQFFGQFLATEAPRAVNTLGTVLGNVVTGFAHLTEDFAPLGHRIEDDLIRWSGIFDRWTQGSGPGQFVAIVERDGPVAAKALGALADGAGGLAKGLEPIGRIELEALTPVLDFIGDLGKQHPAVITALGAGYLSIAGGLKAIAAVKGLAGVVGTLRTLGGLRTTGGGGGGGILGGAESVAGVRVFVTNWPPGFGGSSPIAPGGGGGETPPVEPVPGNPFTGGLKNFAKTIPLYAVGAQSDRHDVNYSDQTLALTQLAVAIGRTRPAGAPKVSTLFGRNNQVKPQDAVSYIETYGTKQQVQQLQDLSTKYPQVKAALDQYNKSLAGLNQLLVVNTGLAALNAKADQEQAATIRRSLQGLPTWIKDAETAAKNGGFVIGDNLDKGIILGLQQGQDKVQLTAVSVTKGTLRAMSKTAELSSPSKVTTQYGKWLAEGLAVGFTGYQAQLLAKFSGGTQTLLNRLGQQLNTAADKYRTDLQGRADLKASIAGNLFGAADIGNAVTSNTGGASLSGFLGNQLATDKRLESLVAMARRRGLDPRLIQQAVNAGGQQGISLLTQALAGGAAGIKTLNAQERALNSVTQAIGGQVSTDVFASTLAKDQRQIDHLARAIENLAAKQLHLSHPDIELLARAIAREISRIFPTLNLAQLDKALGLKITAGG